MDKGEVALEIAILLAGTIAQDKGAAEGLLRTIDRIRDMPSTSHAQHFAITLLETLIHEAHSAARNPGLP
jgi:hypothetical protein